MEQPALLRHVGSTALRVAVARLRNLPCPPVGPRHGSNSPRRPPSPGGTAERPGSRSPGITLPAHRLAGVRKPDARSSSRRGPLASVIRDAGCSMPPRGRLGRGAATLQVRPADVCLRRPTRGPAVQGCDTPGLDGPETPAGGWGRRSRAAAPLQQRGRACVERKPCLGGT